MQVVFMRENIFGKKQHGFTLVELMISLAILSTMTVVSIVSIRSSRTDSSLAAAQREVTAAIKLAQSYALQGKMQNSVTPCGYGLRFKTMEKYEIYYNLLPSTESSCDEYNKDSSHLKFISAAESKVAQSFDLNNDITLNSTPHPATNPAEVYFTVPRAEIKGSLPLDIKFVPRGVTDGTGKKITVGRGGFVTEEN
jgi:prepilin-type N-terminal cleavage/methylation domain-containing protein